MPGDTGSVDHRGLVALGLWFLFPAGSAGAALATHTPPDLKILVEGEGLCRLDPSRLVRAGWDVDQFDPSRWVILEASSRDPIRLDPVPSANYPSSLAALEFPCRGGATRYSRQRAYRLTLLESPHFTPLLPNPPVPEGTENDLVSRRLSLEENRIYRGAYPRDGEGDRWYWDYFGGEREWTVAFDLPGLTEDSSQVEDRIVGPVVLKLDLVGGIGAHRVRLSVDPDLSGTSDPNAMPEAEIRWTGPVRKRWELTLAASSFHDRGNSIRLRGIGASQVLVDSIQIEYPARLSLASEPYLFRPHEPGVPRFDGLRILEPPDSREGWFLAVPEDHRISPAQVIPWRSPGWRSPTHQADYIVITSAEFREAAERLARHRRRGMTVAVVDVLDLYDEFGAGTLDPEAIRAFLSFAAEHWSRPSPRFVVLLGDGHFDYREHCSSPGHCPSGGGEISTSKGSNFIPPFPCVVDPWAGETACDQRFVSPGDRFSITSPALGRLPAATGIQAGAMVDQIIAYETALPPGDWRSRVVLASDNPADCSGRPDRAGDGWEAGGRIAQHPFWRERGLSTERILFDPCGTWSGTVPESATAVRSVGEMRSALRKAFSEALLIGYFGHAGVTDWGHEKFFRRDHEGVWVASEGRPAVVLSSSCYDGFFHHPSMAGLAENLVRAPGGVLAMVATTGMGTLGSHRRFLETMLDAWRQNPAATLGEAITAGKSALAGAESEGTRALLDTLHLFGDPALGLAWPTPGGNGGSDRSPGTSAMGGIAK